MEGVSGKVDSGTQFGVAEAKGSTSFGQRREQTVAFGWGGGGERQGAQGGKPAGCAVAGYGGGQQKHLPHPSVPPDPFPVPALPLTSRNMILTWDQETGEPNGTAH